MNRRYGAIEYYVIYRTYLFMHRARELKGKGKKFKLIGNAFHPETSRSAVLSPSRALNTFGIRRYRNMSR